jgi:AbrB family looped-hinge helix DNA binding protein
MGMPVTTKGQVTIPKPIRDRLGLVPGSRVEFEALPDGRIAIRKAVTDPANPDRFGRLVGCGTALKGMSTDGIMQLLRGDED